MKNDCVFRLFLILLYSLKSIQDIRYKNIMTNNNRCGRQVIVEKKLETNNKSQIEKIKFIDGFINDIDKILENKDVNNAEKQQDKIIAVLGSEISNIESGLSNYNMYGLYNANYKPDFIGDLEILKSKLLNYKANIYMEGDKQSTQNIIYNDNISNINTNIEITINDTIEKINHFPDNLISKEEKEEIEDKLASLERSAKSKDKSKIKSKIANILKYIGDKSIDVAIALLPALGSIAEQLSRF